MNERDSNQARDLNRGIERNWSVTSEFGVTHDAYHRDRGDPVSMQGIMPSAALAHALALDPPRYSKAELIEHRRNILRYARSCPPGPERNQHRQIALSLRALFRNKVWLQAHILQDD